MQPPTSRRLLVGVSVGWVPLAFLFDGVTVLLLPVRFADASGDATLIGLASFVGLAAGVAVQPLAGRLSDRMRGRVYRRSFVVAGAAPALAGLWMLVAAESAAVAVAGYVLAQLGAGVMQAGQQTLIPEAVPGSERGRASGLKAAFDVGGSFLAFLMLGTLLADGALQSAAIAIAVVVVLGVAATALLAPADDHRAGTGSDATAEPSPEFVRLIVARFLFLVGIYAVGRFLVLLVAERLRIDPSRAADEAGALLALLTLSTAAAAIPFGWLADRVSSRRVMAAGVVASAIGIVGLVPAAGAIGLIVGGLAMSIGTAAFVSANWAALTDEAPAEHAGWLMGIASIGTGGAAAVAGLLGPVIDAGGFVSLLIAAAALVAFAAVPLAARPRIEALGRST